jgi:hypothetical protein
MLGIVERSSPRATPRKELATYGVLYNEAQLIPCGRPVGIDGSDDVWMVEFAHQIGFLSQILLRIRALRLDDLDGDNFTAPPALCRVH